MSVPSFLQSSALFEVKETSGAGRGVFAKVRILRGTLLLETSEPAASAIYEEYRKEVCARCFAYDRGRVWKLRDGALNVAFCSEACEQVWTAEQTEGSRHTFVSVESFCKKAKPCPELGVGEEAEIPSEAVVIEAWKAAEQQGESLRAARAAANPSKAHRRVMRSAAASSPDRNVLAFLTSGFFCSILNPEVWGQVGGLASTTTPYRFHLELQYHVAGFLQLLLLLPESLLPDFSSSTLRTLAANSAHNVFNIWSLDVDAAEGGPGSECLGYGLWPAASFWNHSCAPNVKKRRSGRTWTFTADADVEIGQELCITYLGGDEKDLDLVERRTKLQRYWGFGCCCTRCRAEEEQVVSSYDQ